MEKSASWEAFYSLLHTRYYSDDQIENDEMGGAYGTCGGKEDACRVLVSKPDGNRLLGRHRCRSEHNIQMALQEIQWERGLMWLRIGKSGEVL